MTSGDSEKLGPSSERPCPCVYCNESDGRPSPGGASRGTAKLPAPVERFGENDSPSPFIELGPEGSAMVRADIGGGRSARAGAGARATATSTAHPTAAARTPR